MIWRKPGDQLEGFPETTVRLLVRPLFLKIPADAVVTNLRYSDPLTAPPVPSEN